MKHLWLSILLISCILSACEARTDSNTISFSDSAATFTGPAAESRIIYINGRLADLGIIQQLEQQYNIRVQPGSYWYDPISGLWGIWGQANSGYILPGFTAWGEVPWNASGGSTNVYVNGRAIHPTELRYLQSLGPVYAGRYWLDARGNYGLEGGAMVGNLVQAARNHYHGNSGGSTFFRNGYTGIGGGSSGGTSYVIGDGFSVIVD